MRRMKERRRWKGNVARKKRRKGGVGEKENGDESG